MAEQTNTTNTEAHKPNFVEKIMDKITGHHRHHGQSADKHVQDNANAAGASVTGAYAGPPMTTHADPNRQYPDQQQHPDQPQVASVQPVAGGQDLRSAEYERQRPL
ncbi:hypothetical protein BGZ58_006426 [Dissophora ornata]|nr:hypothetical protein BGZ58_006426 [Dissophora ornata]